MKMKEKKAAESLTEEERRALRGSRFSSPLPALPPASTKPSRLAHPGGPYTTNKAAALAKFLERKLQEPGGLTSIDGAVVEAAVRDAKDTLKASCSSGSGKSIKHVTSFPDCTEDCSMDEDTKSGKSKKKKKAKHAKGTKKTNTKKKKVKHS